MNDREQGMPMQNPTINSVRLANAVGLVATLAYALCGAVSVVAPGLYRSALQSLFHGMTLDPLFAASPPFRLDSFAVGVQTVALTVWLFTAASAALYNRWPHT